MVTLYKDNNIPVSLSCESVRYKHQTRRKRVKQNVARKRHLWRNDGHSEMVEKRKAAHLATLNMCSTNQRQVNGRESSTHIDQREYSNGKKSYSIGQGDATNYIAGKYMALQRNKRERTGTMRGRLTWRIASRGTKRMI